MTGPACQRDDGAVTSPAPLNVGIRPAREGDLAGIVAIYNQAVEDRASTCDLSGFTPEERRGWFHRHVHPFGIWVAEHGTAAVGWVALSPFVDRPCFRRTALSATYVDRAWRGRGVGKALRHQVVDRARENGFHSLVARVWANNEISARLSEQLGYQLVGTLKEVVSVDGRMLDVAFYQRFLEGEPARD